MLSLKHLSKMIDGLRSPHATVNRAPDISGVDGVRLNSSGDHLGSNALQDYIKRIVLRKPCRLVLVAECRRDYINL